MVVSEIPEFFYSLQNVTSSPHAVNVPFISSHNIQIQPSLKAELLLVYFLAPHYNENCDKTLQHWLQKSFFKGLRDQSGGWGGQGSIGVVWNLGTTFSQHAMKRMLVSGIFKQLRTFAEVPYMRSKFSMIENLFFFRGSVRCQHQLK